MDFTLALAHFCEKHGPKSVLCTQVRPLECRACVPTPQRRERTASFESYTTQTSHLSGNNGQTTPTPRLRRTSTDLSIPSNLSPSLNIVEPPSETTNIEEHPYFQTREVPKDGTHFPFQQRHSDICASCSFAVPQKVAAKLPAGAPGSLSGDGMREPSSAPVLRSREFVCLGNKRRRQSKKEQSFSQDSHGTSVTSQSSIIPHENCHDHTLTYLTSKSPFDPEAFATLRNSVVRALSGEQLPQGMSEGPFCFGDPSAGYTIAYSFRLTDPRARGRVRRYAFVALAGKDAYRAFKACPMLWEAFAVMSKTIEKAAQRYQDEQERQQQREREEQLAKDTKAGYTNISSFLTQKPRDRDGQPRRVGQTLPLNLGEIIGDENIFAVLHQYFVHVLRCLGDRFGGLPFAEPNEIVFQTAINEKEAPLENKMPPKHITDMLGTLNLDEDEETEDLKPKYKAKQPDKSKSGTHSTSVSQAPNAGSTQQVKRNSHCAPFKTEKNTQRRVVV